MEGLIKTEVELREKKWKYLVRGLCRVEEMEEQCEAILSSVKRMT